VYPLRPYQSAFIADINAAFTRVNRVCGVMPTGAGKTVVFCQIAADHPGPVWILVHRVELIEQTSRKLREQNIPHGIIAPGFPPDSTQRIQLASVFTLARRDITGGAGGLVIVDECHHAVSNTWRQCIERLTDLSGGSLRILGVTATPERLDGRGLSTEFDELVLGPTTQQLIDLGYLARPIVYAPPMPPLNLDNISTRGGDYALDQLEMEISKPNITGCAVEHFRNLAPGQTAIAFCVTVAHARSVASAFRSAGILAESIDGTLSSHERARIIQGLSNNQESVLASCSLIDEGFDAPSVGAIIDLAPTRSLARFLQRCGRSLRIHPGKTHATIIDAVGNHRRHGLPHWDRPWLLTSGKRSKSGAIVALKTCPECFRTTEPRAECYCGYVYPLPPPPKMIEIIPGELVEVDSDLAKEHFNIQRKRARSLTDLQRLGAVMGYHPGWAENYHRARISKLNIRYL
jgi:DNA repair protein RadD